MLGDGTDKGRDSRADKGTLEWSERERNVWTLKLILRRREISCIRIGLSGAGLRGRQQWQLPRAVQQVEGAKWAKPATYTNEEVILRVHLGCQKTSS